MSSHAPPLIQYLANWSAGLDAAKLDASVCHAARRAIVDTTGVMLAGAVKPLSRNVALMIEDESQPGHATIFAAWISRKPAGAALANGVAAHQLDFDDTSFDGILHASCVVFPAVLACAEDADATCADLMAAFVVGSEITYALGRALTNIFWQGWWTTATLGSIGAAAGACRAFGLDATATAHAMAIASSLTFGIRTILGTDANPIGAGMAAQAGVRAALLARGGANGNLATIEHPIGLAKVFNRGMIDADRLKQIGSYFSMVESGLAFKAYPACSGTQAASQAVGELMSRSRLKPDDVRKVTCRVAPLVAENLRYPEPVNLTQAQFSLPFAVGCFLAYGEFSVRQLKDDVLHSSELRAAMSKVTMVCVDDLADPGNADKYPEAAEIVMELTSGEILRHKVLAAHGMPVDPMSDAEVRSKFMDCAQELVSGACATSLHQQLCELGSARPARQLFASVRSEMAERLQ